MSAALTDHITLGLSRVALQYQNSPKFLAYLRALLAPGQEIESALQQLSLLADIDEMRGVNLDVIGEIVGVGRIIPESVPLQFFGFEGQASSTVFGENNQLGIGARFRDEDEPWLETSVLGDPEYRMLIRAKIVKNHSRGTNEDIIQGLVYLFNAPNAVVEDTEEMAFDIAIGRQLTYQEKAIITQLDVLSRPSGVRVRRRLTYDANKYFGFEGQPNAAFGEEGQPAVGGLFAEEF